MTTVLTIMHVLVSLALIVAVLLQRGVGAEAGVSFGGGSSQTIFGARGATPFLAKLTWGLAVAFMALSLTLAFFAHREAGSAAERLAPAAAPTQPSAPASQQGGGFDPSKLKQDDLPPAE